MNILELAILKKMVGGGGGSGTDNYNDLSNLPQINGETLAGNKSSSNLGLQDEIDSDNKLASDLIDDENQENKFVTSSEKNTWNAKQNAIDSDHKLDADLVDDSESTNKFVTASDKEAWNAKQNEIDSDHKLSSDLVDDANKTNKFVTSTEKNTWNAKQNAIDSDHKLSSSLVSFSEAESAALASGIDSTKVGQISTNQTNILYSLQNGAKNFADIGSATFTAESGASGLNRVLKVNCHSITGNIVISIGTISSTDTDASTCAYILYYTDGTTSGSNPRQFNRGNNITAEYNIGTKELDHIEIYPSDNFNHSSGDTLTLTNFMVVSKIIWDTVGHDYQPPALPNYDLTRLESEDRAGLVECVDGGAKNLLSIEGETREVNGVTATYNSDGSITTSGTASGGNANFTIRAYTPAEAVKLSGLVLSGCPSGGSTNTWRLILQKNSANYDVYAEDTGNGAVIGTVPSVSCVLILQIKSGYSKNATWYPMLCTKAAFGVSQKFVSYYNPASPVLGGGYEIPQNSSMDSLISIGKWRCYNSDIASTVTNTPFRNGFFGWTTNSITDSTRYVQIAISNADVFEVAKRRWYGTIWSDWEYISSDAVTHYKADTTTTIGTDWTLTSIVLQAPADALVSMTATAFWGTKAPRGIRITRTNTSATNNVIATIEVSEDKGQIQASGFGVKLYGGNTYYVWAKAKESGTMPVYLTYSYPIKG